MSDTNTTQSNAGGAPVIPFEQISELQQQATLCTLALNEKDGLLDGSQVAWGGSPRTVDEQKALLAAHHDKAVAIMEAVLASPKGRDVLPIAWPPVAATPIAPVSGAPAPTDPATTEAQPAAVVQVEAAGAPGKTETPVQAHAGHESVLRKYLKKMLRGEQVFVHEIEAELRKVL